jgi:hypothetical protein
VTTEKSKHYLKIMLLSFLSSETRYDGKKLIFTFGAVLLTSKICVCCSKHDIPKTLEMVIYPCFLDDIHSILDNSCMCLNELIRILS